MSYRTQAIANSPCMDSWPRIGGIAGIPFSISTTRDFPRRNRHEVVMNSGGGFIEVQGTAEGHAFRRHELDALLDLAASGMATLFELQSGVRAA